MTTENHRINSTSSYEATCKALWSFWVKHKYANVALSTRRSLDQNALVNQWYSDIARQYDGNTFLDVRRQCKLDYGVPILKRDCEVHNYVFSKSLDRIRDREKRLKVMDTFAVTSAMSTAQLKEYLNQMHQDHPYLVVKKNGN